MNVSQKKLSLIPACSVVVGCVIGSGVFVKPGIVLKATGNSTLAILAWVLGGVISITGGLTIAEIASRVHRTGGASGYIEEIYGKTWSYLCGWVQAIIYGPGLIGALASYFGVLLVQFMAYDESLKRPIALAVLFFLTALNMFGTYFGGIVQTVSTFAKLIPIFAIAIIGLMKGDASILGVSVSSGSASAGFGTAILATLWAYDGWFQVTNVGQSIVNPMKNLPRAIIYGLVLVMAVYLAVNMSLIHVLSAERLAELNEKGAAGAAEILFGSIGAKFLSIGVLISIFGCLNGNILATIGIPLNLAEKKALPFYSLFSKKIGNGMGIPSAILNSGIAALMICFLNPDRITDIAMFSMYLFYTALFVGVFLLRKKMGAPKEGEYKVPFFPIVPIVASIGGVIIAMSMLKDQPIYAVYALSVMAVGLLLKKVMLSKVD